jgi:signal transduction histidine kinase
MIRRGIGKYGITTPYITRRWGLQAAMTGTYVAVTAAAVLLTELVILGMTLLAPLRSQPLLPQQVQGLAQATAAGLAAKLAASKSHVGESWSRTLGTAGLPVTPGKAQLDGIGGVAIPVTTNPLCDLAPASFAVVVSQDRTVLASSYPACYPVGSTGAAVQGGAPGKVLVSFGWPAGGSALSSLPTGDVAWAAAPIVVPAAQSPKAGASASSAGASSAGASSGGTGSAGTSGAVQGDGSVFAMVYVQVPAAAARTSGSSVSPALAWSGLVVLAASVPVGLAFGLLSTRRLTRRLKRLAAATLEVADGQFGQRIQVSGHDEVSRLEDNFNRMAAQLQASLAAMRQLAEAGARQDERSRIARELHDSISQELFSIQALAGGLRRTLPPGSDVLPAVETMEQTAGDTMREMRSLLLALRPVALDEAGLAGAIEGVCRVYTERFGVRVNADIAASGLPPPLEHAILRVTQEAVANAVRHSGASTVAVRLSAGTREAMLEIADDGRGFDVLAREESGAGLGLRAMRDRVAEHGGQFAIMSTSGGGTTVRATFPLERT